MHHRNVPDHDGGDNMLQRYPKQFLPCLKLRHGLNSQEWMERVY